MEPVEILMYCVSETIVVAQESEDDAWTGPVDKDGFPMGRTPDDKKKIEALPPVDHSQIEVRTERWDGKSLSFNLVESQIACREGRSWLDGEG